MIETNTNSPAPAASKKEIGDALMMAVLDCRRQNNDDKIVLHRDTEVPGCVLEQLRERLIGAAPELVAAVDELARSQRIILAMAEDLSAINEKLELDPDDGGADPIIEAIDQLQADLAAARRPAAEPLHDNLRDQIGQAINDAIASGAPQADYCDSREIDRPADAVLAILPPLRSKVALSPELRAALDEAAKTGALAAMLPNGSAVFINRGEQPGDFGEADECPACGGSGNKADATARAATTASLVELRDQLHGAARAGDLIVLAPEAAGALVRAMSTGAPAGGAEQVAEFDVTQGMTDEQIDAAMATVMPGTRPSACFRKFARAILAAKSAPAAGGGE